MAILGKGEATRGVGNRPAWEINDTAPQGPAKARCTDICEQNNVEVLAYMSQTQYKTVDRISFLFEITALDGQTYQVTSRWMNIYDNMDPKSHLYKFVFGWTADDPSGVDTETLRGKEALLTITHYKSGDNVYANIGSIMPVPPGYGLPTPSAVGDAALAAGPVADADINPENPPF